MGCRCGQKGAAARGAAGVGQRSYPAPVAPGVPEYMAPLRGVPAGMGPAEPPSEWFRVDLADDQSVWYVDQASALAFAGGRHPVTRTTTPPPVMGG